MYKQTVDLVHSSERLLKINNFTLRLKVKILGASLTLVGILFQVTFRF